MTSKFPETEIVDQIVSETEQTPENIARSLGSVTMPEDVKAPYYLAMSSDQLMIPSLAYVKVNAIKVPAP